MREDPENRLRYQGLQATAAVGLGEHERAVALYRELLRGTSADADVHLSIAHALKTIGRQEEAIESYRNAAAARPDFGDAYWSIANLKTYRFTPEELSRLKALLADPGGRPGRSIPPVFRTGQGLEDQGEYAESFRYYEMGNALKRAESHYRPAQSSRTTPGCRLKCARASSLPDTAAPAPRIRTRSLSSACRAQAPRCSSRSWPRTPQVEGTQELAYVQQIVAKLRGRDPDLDNPRYPRVLAEMDAEEFRKLGEQYLADAQVFRHGKPFFIDKMPNNFRHLGLIHLMLPNAKIIDARREPMACCFSNLKQLYAKGQEFTYSIEDIARYYRTYLELMRHWDRVLPGRILRVQHEDVVDDLEGNVRRMLDFCGLRVRAAVRRVLQDPTQRAHRQFRAGAPSPSIAKVSISGRILSRGWASSRTPWVMR